MASAPRKEAAFAKAYLRLTKGEGYHWGMMRSAWAPPAELAVMQMQDLLGLGSEARMNTPSTLGGNWVWRARPGFASRELAERVRHQMELYHRLPPIKVVPDDYARRGAAPVSGAGIMRTGQFRFRI